jgi:hypothetical protein
MQDFMRENDITDSELDSTDFLDARFIRELGRRTD